MDNAPLCSIAFGVRCTCHTHWSEEIYSSLKAFLFLFEDCTVVFVQKPLVKTVVSYSYYNTASGCISKRNPFPFLSSPCHGLGFFFFSVDGLPFGFLHLMPWFNFLPYFCVTSVWWVNLFSVYLAKVFPFVFCQFVCLWPVSMFES